MPYLLSLKMSTISLLKRQKRIAMRKKSVDNDSCPNCSVKLREKWHGGLSCSKCHWEK